MVFSVLSYNIWFDCYLQIERIKSLIKIINIRNPDVICLQEVKPAVYKLLKVYLPDYDYYPKEIINSYECVIFSKYKINNKTSYMFSNSTMGRQLLFIIIKIDLTDIVITTSHFESQFNTKNIEKVKQYKITEKILNALYDKYKNVIFGGDCNVLQHEEKFMFCNNNFKDAYVEKGMEEDNITFNSKTNPYLIPKNWNHVNRLDRIIYKLDSFNISKFELIKGINYDLCEPSDHYGVLCTFNKN